MQGGVAAPRKGEANRWKPDSTWLDGLSLLSSGSGIEDRSVGIHALWICGAQVAPFVGIRTDVVQPWAAGIRGLNFFREVIVRCEHSVRKATSATSSKCPNSWPRVLARKP